LKKGQYQINRYEISEHVSICVNVKMIDESI